MDKKGWFWLFGLVASMLLYSGCSQATEEEFGIYLLGQEMATEAFMSASLASLALQAEPLLRMDDILAYDQGQYQMELTEEAYQRFQSVFPTPVDVDGIPFVVTIGKERIYRGALWTPLSSLSFDGVIILQPFDSENQTIELMLGYPSQQVFTGEDPRNDERILRVFEAAGKLH